MKKVSGSRNDYKTISRRRFFGVGGAVVAGGLFNNRIFKRGIITSYAQKNSIKNKGNKIIFRTLGKTGIKLPVVSMGVMNADNPALVKKSYEIGVRHFDTAATYQRGKNEEMVGKVIEELNVRDQVIIATKVYLPHNRRNMLPDEAKNAFLKSAEESLRRLKTDYVDILYSHNVNNLDYLNNPGILEAFQLLKKQKKIRFSGFSTHQNMKECIRNATKTGAYDVILTTYNYAVCDDSDFFNVLEQAASKGIGLIAMKTQCSQYWYKEHVPEAGQKYYQGRIMHTAVLKWALRNDFITTTIPGYVNFQQMDEDFSVAFNLGYTDEEKKFLEDKDVKFSLGYCHQCKKCVSTCPKGVDIPTLMRTHMYALCYTNIYQARNTLDSISQNKGLDACTSCRTCSAICANRIDISKRVDELKVIYV